jgi:succinoglycan biosynthesis protein ExoA
MLEPPRIVTVIPCLNEEQHLEKLVLQLVSASRVLPMQIVVADGGSTDRTCEIADRLSYTHDNVALIHNPRRLQSAGINKAAAAYAEAEYLIRIDAHAEYPDNYCQILLDEMAKTGAHSIVVTMNTIGTGGFQKAVALVQNSRLGNGGAAHRNQAAEGMWVDHGHHALIRLDALRAVGGYDENFSHNEDAEFDIRLRQAGYKIWLTGRTSVTYFPRSTPLALFRQYIKHGFGRASTIMKHCTVPKLRQLAPAAVLPAMLLALFASRCALLALPLLFWGGVCLVYGLMLGIRAGDIRLAMAGPAAMLMHAGWSIGFWRGIATAALKRMMTG